MYQIKISSEGSHTYTHAQNDLKKILTQTSLSNEPTPRSDSVDDGMGTFALPVDTGQRPREQELHLSDSPQRAASSVYTVCDGP